MTFHDIGERIALKGNQVTLLWQEKVAYYVQQGKVNIFAVHQEKDNLLGKRQIVLEVKEGELFFGSTEMLSETGYGFIACGGLETYVQAIPLEVFHQHLFTLSMDEIMEVIKMLQKWEGGLLKSIDITARYELQGMEDDPIIALERFHREIIGKVEAKFKKAQDEEARRIEMMKRENNRSVHDTLHILATTLDRRKEKEDSYSYDAKPLLGAYKEISKIMALQYNEDWVIDHRLPPEEARRKLRLLARIKMRRVALLGRWWQKTSVPMIGYLKEDNIPVALIPKGKRGYRMYHPITKEWIPLEEWVSERLTGEAYCIYKVFDDAPIGAMKMIRWGMCNCERRDIWLILLLGVLGSFISIMIPYTTGLIFNQIIPQGEKQFLIQLGMVLLCVGVSDFIFNITKDRVLLRVEGQMDMHLQGAFWERLLGLPATFFGQYESGDLGKRMLSIKEVRQLFTAFISILFFTSIVFLSHYGMLFFYAPSLAMMMSFFFIGMMIVGIIGHRKESKMIKYLLKCENELSGKIYQYINSVGKLKSSGAMQRAIKVWAGDYQKMKQESLSFLTYKQHIQLLLVVIPSVATVYLFTEITFSTSLRAGDVIAFYSAFTKCLGCVLTGISGFYLYSRLKNTYEMISPILQTEKEYQEMLPSIERLTGEIDVGAVSFSYEKDGPMILRDINLKISPGEYVGIVGSSGSGKTTLFRILLGFEKPTLGGVYYNGKDINKVDIRSVREQIGVVLQNGQLIPDTIYHNIVGENIYLTMEDAIEAARMAGIYDDIEEMPMGMHTMISEGAKTISGGQKQRILIARAIANKPKVLYFDEATSALDNNTQDIVSRSLYQLNTTRIVIAHRLSTIKKCDRIIVLEKGEIKEEGNYETLMQKQGFFYQMAKRQL